VRARPRHVVIGLTATSPETSRSWRKSAWEHAGRGTFGGAAPAHALPPDRPHPLEPLVRAGRLRAGRRRPLLRDALGRRRVRPRAHPAGLHRRARCRPGHPLGRRDLDGEPRGARPHDHDGRRPACDGSVLAAHRAADPARQAESVRDRHLRRDVRSRDARDARRARRRRQRQRHGAGARRRGGVPSRLDLDSGARPLRAPHRPLAPPR
jgi:hypothetical protein